MNHPVPTRGFLKLSPDMVMLFAPFKCTPTPPLVRPFLLMSLKDIATSEIMDQKVL